MRAEGGEQAVRPPRLRAASQRALLQLQWAYKLLLLQGEAAARVSPTSYCMAFPVPLPVSGRFCRAKNTREARVLGTTHSHLYPFSYPELTTYLLKATRIRILRSVNKL